MSVFITFEGPEGCGKTTQATILKKEIEAIGLDILLTREPGGSFFGKEIRNIILKPEHRTLCAEAELFLYLADRAQHVFEKIAPALERGCIVVSDRFADATLAYQGYGRNLDIEFIKKALVFAIKNIRPDLTFFLDIEPSEVINRAINSKNEFSNSGDRLENEDLSFHKRVFEGYKKIIKMDSQRFEIIDGSLSIEEISGIIKKRVFRLIEEQGIL